MTDLKNTIDLPPRDELVAEVRRWDARELTPGDWEPAPEAIPRARETKAISIRLPVVMLTLLKAFAEREGIGYQVLMKRWLDARLRQERDALRLRREKAESGGGLNAVLPAGERLVDRRPGDRSGHLEAA